MRNTSIELKMLLSLGLDYFRWTQLTPMLFTWGFALLMLGGFILNYFAVPENFNGAMAGWMFQFSLIALLVFVVSAYSLSVSHALGRLNAILMKEPAGVSS